eukprot:m.75684 g.75684  ORF g.75684 m.75684 type:complete len:78 (-) comp18986_c0_seq1:278-511(-)
MLPLVQHSGLPTLLVLLLCGIIDTTVAFEEGNDDSANGFFIAYSVAGIGAIFFLAVLFGATAIYKYVRTKQKSKVHG